MGIHRVKIKRHGSDTMWIVVTDDDDTSDSWFDHTRHDMTRWYPQVPESFWIAFNSGLINEFEYCWRDEEKN